ncbi:MAG: hypothetical protein V8R63_11780 [Thomasclavelia ramosa]
MIWIGGFPNHPRTAAIILEPVQGEEGGCSFSQETMKESTIM